jgi:hypothetical protein
MSCLFSTSLLAVPMEHQTAGVRPTRLRRAVSQPLDRVESSRGSRGFMTSPRPVARAPCSFGSLGACPGQRSCDHLRTDLRVRKMVFAGVRTKLFPELFPENTANLGLSRIPLIHPGRRCGLSSASRLKLIPHPLCESWLFRAGILLSATRLTSG